MTFSAKARGIENKNSETSATRRGGFRQKAAFLDFLKLAALCPAFASLQRDRRDAATQTRRFFNFQFLILILTSMPCSPR